MSPLHVTFPCPITILLLRHAERAVTLANDPPLTPAGVQRALALVDATRGAGVSAIFTTQFIRTVQTAQPLAQNLGITPTVLAVAPATPGPYVEELVSQIRGMPPRTTALVVSHTTTSPMIGAALGAPAIAPSPTPSSTSCSSSRFRAGAARRASSGRAMARHRRQFLPHIVAHGDAEGAEGDEESPCSPPLRVIFRTGARPDRFSKTCQV